MEPKKNRLIRHFAQTPLAAEVAAFLVDREARGLSPRTLDYYGEQLDAWLGWLSDHDIATLDQITAKSLRQWVSQLMRSRSPGGVAASYRAVRAFMRWCWQENERPGRNPIAKVRPPKVPDEPLEPLSLDTLKALLDTCNSRTLSDQRDKAMLLALLDTGCRAAEFVALDVGDVDLGSGLVRVRYGKGGNPRIAFLGSICKRELLRYLRHFDETPPHAPLWITIHGERLTYQGLRSVLRRRSERAGVDEPTLHSFRRAFALMSLRNGVDVYSLQRLMGHADLTMLRRYLAQTDADIQEAHDKAGPVDHWL